VSRTLGRGSNHWICLAIIDRGRAACQDTARRMLTKKGKYGLKALVHLSRLPSGQLAFVGDIARANNIPKKFLDAILAELRNAGFVQSRKGKEGGYRPARPASEIKVGHIIRVLDGPLAPIPCASRTRYEPCDDCDEATCQVRHMMLEVRNAIAEVLDNRSLAEMRDTANDDLDLPQIQQA
jgi:Rrf2 family protein